MSQSQSQTPPREPAPSLDILAGQSSNTEPPVEPATKDKVQAKLAKKLVSSLLWIYGGIFFLLFVDKVIFIYFNLEYLHKGVAPDDLNFQDNSKDLITLVLSTSSALAGSAIGFYFNNIVETDD